MGLATEFLAGNPSEWALTRRDATEQCFGIQVAGARTQQVRFFSLKTWFGFH